VYCIVVYKGNVLYLCTCLTWALSLSSSMTESAMKAYPLPSRAWKFTGHDAKPPIRAYTCGHPPQAGHQELSTEGCTLAAMRTSGLPQEVY